jgi:hypothetical protein
MVSARIDVVCGHNTLLALSMFAQAFEHGLLTAEAGNCGTSPGPYDFLADES